MSQSSPSAARGSPTPSTAPPPAAATGDFVVNLCASTTPMALAKPASPELARYTFFVSRRREEGRERFRLHMGYFATREDAEQMLALVRDLYPAAWVGETPGRKLAAGTRAATPASAAAVTPAAPKAAAPAVSVPAAAVAGAAPAQDRSPAPAPALSSAPAPAPAVAVAAPPVAAPAVAAPPAAPASVALPAAVVPPPPQPKAAAPAVEPQPSLSATTRARALATPVAAQEGASTSDTVAMPTIKPAPRGKVAANRPATPPASNVREVIAALEPEAIAPPPTTTQRAALPPAATPRPTSASVATGPASAAAPARSPAPSAAAKPAPAATAPAAPAAPPRATNTTSTTSTPPRAPAPIPAVRSTAPGADMTDSQVLRVLEGRGSAPQGRGAAPEGVRDIALLSPQDTQTWNDIKAQIKRDAAVHFAVQLNWSVTPIDLARVPSLAIFNAYTLYKIEGNREGRKWYGLRLGFFSDAVSAKQVAHYVRSEFAQVAVVPVSVNEREQAKQIGAIALPSTTPAARPNAPASDEFKLIDDEPAAPAAVEALQPEAVAPEPAPTRPVAASPAARGPAANRRPDRPRGAPQSLEETLEILGASQLSIDNGRGERVVIDGRARQVDPPTSTFSKLLDRLGERLRK